MAGFPRSVLITGANRGLGLETVKQFISKGEGTTQHIIATHRSPVSDDKNKELVDYAAKNKSVHLLQLDVSSHQSILAAAKKVDELVGQHGLNVIIHNAAFTQQEFSLDDLTEEALLQSLQANTVGPALITKAFHSLLKRAADLNKDKPIGWERAAILYISSYLASLELAGGGGDFDAKNFKNFSYRVSKSATNMLARSLAPSLLEDGIASQLIHPGWVRTDSGGPDAPLSPEESVKGVLAAAGQLDKDSTCTFTGWDGLTVPW